MSHNAGNGMASTSAIISSLWKRCVDMVADVVQPGRDLAGSRG